MSQRHGLPWGGYNGETPKTKFVRKEGYFSMNEPNNVKNRIDNEESLQDSVPDLINAVTEIGEDELEQVSGGGGDGTAVGVGRN